jgi:hypothetical protein
LRCETQRNGLLLLGFTAFYPTYVYYCLSIAVLNSIRYIFVGWVEVRNPTKWSTAVGFHCVLPNLRVLSGRDIQLPLTPLEKGGIRGSEVPLFKGDLGGSMQKETLWQIGFEF